MGSTKVVIALISTLQDLRDLQDDQNKKDGYKSARHIVRYQGLFSFIQRTKMVNLYHKNIKNQVLFLLILFLKIPLMCVQGLFLVVY